MRRDGRTTADPLQNTDATLSSPHILEADSLQFRLVGRKEAIDTAAMCYRNIIAIATSTASDRTRQAMPVCSGSLGLRLRNSFLEIGIHQKKSIGRRLAAL
ncbi:TPA: hypothetical protein N0F65_002273 [Lagenidium giganteum]|uniref:Uncharacterized protein n=1 Tax=Lagenidium giganteum TaxID=4803 RepID=A0AAV2YR05_9STRA|nr:TPA: hypothetical protein N0F65_002273 [Lagenidium giganteum]